MLLFVGTVHGQDRALDTRDAIRLKEAFALAESVGDNIWENWSATPFAVLLLTPEKDLLVGHPGPSADFVDEGVDDILGMNVYSRPRTQGWPSGMLATFPAVGGLSTVVVGQAEATGMNSTRWVLTLLHEHFHQYQNGWSGYFSGVDKLDLSGGDETGMWMLNYAFPYDDPVVAAAVTSLRTAIQSSLKSGSGEVRDVSATLQKIESLVSEKDFRYLSFQLWQEGVSRYTEQIVAGFAENNHESGDDFSALEDAITYRRALSELTKVRQSEMMSLDLKEQKRVVFYALGASLAMILDTVRPDWRSDYFEKPFDLVSLVTNEN